MRTRLPAPEAFFRRRAIGWALALLAVALIAVRTDAQTEASTETPGDPVAAAIAAAARAAQRTDEPATLVYANRRIVESARRSCRARQPPAPPRHPRRSTPLWRKSQMAR